MIYVFLANGFEEVEALAPVDLLRRAGKQVTLVGIGGEEIQGAHGITVRADIPDVLFRDPNPEAILLPGGMPGAKNLDASPVVDTAIRVTAKNGGYVCAICAAPYLLGKRGLLKGKKATCYPGFEPELTGATVTGERLVQDDRFVTAMGPGVAVEYGFLLVELLAGKDKADELRRGFISD